MITNIMMVSMFDKVWKRSGVCCLFCFSLKAFKVYKKTLFRFVLSLCMLLLNYTNMLNDWFNEI